MGNTQPSTIVYSIALPDTEVKGKRSSTRRGLYFPDNLISNYDPPIRNAWELFQMGVAKCADQPCIGSREKDLSSGKLGEYKWKTFKEVENLALQFGGGLFNLGCVPEQTFDDDPNGCGKYRFLAIYAKNREEWIICEQACNAYGVCIVPLYDTLGQQSTAFILKQTQLHTVAASNECCQQLIESVEKELERKNGNNKEEKNDEDKTEKGQTENLCRDLKTKYDAIDLALKFIIYFDPISDELKQKAKTLGIEMVSFDHVLYLGKQNMKPPTPGEPSLECANTICYTSGTTGLPKGVIVTHANFVAVAASNMRGALGHIDVNLTHKDIVLSYLPLAHIYERVVENVLLSIGGQVGFYSGDTLKLLDDIQALNPTIFCSVPRLFNRINDRIFDSLKEKSSFAQSLFERGLDAKIRRVRSTGITTHPLWDKLVFNKTKNLMGYRVRLMLSGSAPLELLVQDRMRSLLCCPLVEGYGLTETTAGIFMANPIDPEGGHIGGPCAGVEFCLGDISDEMQQYSVSGSCPKGELWIRGPVVSPGYFRNEEETKSVYDEEGWLHTGDVAALLPSGALKIIDRKKNIFKLSQGEYISPEKIESIYSHCEYISQVFIFGKSTESALIAFIVPDEAVCKKWILRNKKTTKYEDLDKDQDFMNDLNNDLKEVSKKAGLKGFEQAKKFRLHFEPFSVENSLLTPTLKLKRAAARDYFQKQIDEMYEELKTTNN